MSTAEILDRLPALDTSDLEVIYRRAIELHQCRTIEASPELLAAIDEADKSFETEGGVSIDEARRIMASGNIS